MTRGVTSGSSRGLPVWTVCEATPFVARNVVACWRSPTTPTTQTPGPAGPAVVVGFPALHGVTHGPHGVHVPASPHISQVVGTAQCAVDGAVPRVEGVALVLVAVPSVDSVGAFGCVQVRTHKDVGALE